MLINNLRNYERFWICIFHLKVLIYFQLVIFIQNKQIIKPLEIRFGSTLSQYV